MASRRASTCSRLGKTSGSWWAAHSAISADFDSRASKRPKIAPLPICASPASQERGPGIRAAAGHWDLPAALDPRRCGAVCEGGSDPPTHRHAPVMPSIRRSARAWVPDPNSAGRARRSPGQPPAGSEGGLEHIGVRQIAALHPRGSSGRSSNLPPRSASKTAANTLGESRFGRQSQSTDPSRATSATVRPSPIAAYSPMGE